MTLEKLRICPQPQQWDALWRLIGAPNDLMPMILARWTFTTDRQKRKRFEAQVEYARKIGLEKDVQLFLSKLGDDQWHYCREDQLDFDYADVAQRDYQRMLAQEEAAQEAIETAKTLYSELRSLNQSEAFTPDNLSDFLHRWYGRFHPYSFETDKRIAEIEASLSLDEQTEWSTPTPQLVEAELEAWKLRLKTELLLLKLEQSRMQYLNADGWGFWAELFGEAEPSPA